MSTGLPGCPLCEGIGGDLVWQGQSLRVIRAQEPLYPAWYRVIRTDHVKEFSQLSREDRLHCMEVVNTTEQVLIEELAPAKINLAQFGNMVPHLHWHIIARFDWDAHFPNPSWGSPVRQVEASRTAVLLEACERVNRLLGQRLHELR